MDKWLTPDYRQHMDPHRPEQWVQHFGFRAAASLMLDHYHYFTHEDVDLLRANADRLLYRECVAVERLADRIEALLPPRDDGSST